jgi:hypothetical protein
MVSRSEIMDRWPHIGRFVQIDESTGAVRTHFYSWDSWAKDSAERAAGYEEWAEFYEWHLLQRAEEWASDRGRRYLEETWTDSMAYCARRCAAYARGENPGEAIPQRVRRPDLEATQRAIVDEVTAELDRRWPLSSTRSVDDQVRTVTGHWRLAPAVSPDP